MVKNLVLWVVVAVVMMTAYQSFNSNGVSDSTDYTTFVYDVSNSQVKEARFDANEITVTKNDGSKYMTVMPPLEDKKLLDDLLNKKVKYISLFLFYNFIIIVYYFFGYIIK